MDAPNPARRLLHGLGPVFIGAAHLGCVLLLVHGLGWSGLLWAAALYVLRMLAITATYHRLIAHRSYQAPRLVWWLGFWRSQLGWLLTPDFHPAGLTAHVESDPVLRLIDRLHVVPPLLLAWL